MPSTKAKPANAPAAGYCGAKKRNGEDCKRAKGYGTKHRGKGRCKYHGGSTPNHEKAAAREEAQEYAARALKATDADVLDPLDSLVLSVHLAQGAVNFYRQEADRNASALPEYFTAVERLNRFSKAAVDAKVADRIAAIGERAGEQIALICEEALAALVKAGAALTVAQRTAYAQAVGETTARLEESSPKLLPPGAMLDEDRAIR